VACASMDSQFEIQYSHRLKGHFPVQEIDTEFYKTLNPREAFHNPETGFPEPPIPSTDQDLTVVGTAVLSSAFVAKCIKAWLDKNATKITIADSRARQNVQFEGPNINETADSIKRIIDDLVQTENTHHIRIRALRILTPNPFP